MINFEMISSEGGSKSDCSSVVEWRGGWVNNKDKNV